MVILMLEHVTPSLRGELSRWMIEPRAGVFIGSVSAMVREKLWEFVGKKGTANTAMTMIYSAKTEQGYLVRTLGDTTRKTIEFDGITLIKRLEQKKAT